MGKTQIAKKMVWRLVKKVSRSGTMIVVFLSESGMATPKSLSPVFKDSLSGVLIAEGPVNSNAAEQVFKEAMKLYQQATAESLRQAIPKFEEAARLFKQAGDLGLEAKSLFRLGNVYDDLGEKQKALEFYNQALPLLRAVGDKSGEANTLNDIGVVYNSLGEKQKALEFYNQALPLRRAVGNKGGEATTLNNIGLVYDSLGEKQKALEFYNQALPMLRAVGDKRGEARTLNNIGLVYDDLGEKQKALQLYNQALPMLRAVGDKRGEATTINNIGAVYESLGEKQKALELYNQALPLLRAVGDKRGEARTLNNIGAVYNELGEKQKALEFYNQALPMLEALGNKGGEATTLNNIGGVYNELGEKQKALQFYNQALPLRRAVGDRSGEATTLNNIGLVYNDLQEKQKALEFYNQALPLRRAVGDKRGEARTLNNIGLVYDDLQEKQKALEFYNQALPLLRAVGDRGGEARTLFNMADLERDRGNLDTALTKIESAITIVEDLRTKIGSQELRASYFATVQSYYQLYIDLLMQLHQQKPSKDYDAIALHVSERARARSLLELLTEAGANIRQGVDPQLLEKERNLQQQLNTIERRKHEFLNSQYTQKQLEEIVQQSNSLFTQIDQIKAQIRLNSPRYAALKYPQPLTLQQIQQEVLDENTLLLQYSLGEERSYLWAVTKNSINSYVLPKQSEIEAAVQTFRKSVTQNSGANLEIGLPLSQILLSPIANQLANKRLIIVGDGALQYVPFAALPIPSNPANPLLVQNEIVTLPSASTIAIQRRLFENRTPAAKTLAVIADPVFNLNDSRLANRQQEKPETEVNSALTRASRNLGLGEGGVVFDRLKFTRTEAEKILALVPEDSRLQALDFKASREIATSPNLEQYQIVHLATHGLLDPVNPELSGVVLSLYDENGKIRDGFLRLQDIFNLNLPAELVVLSACETGLGENVKGEGLVGLTRGFMYAGAKRVVVSLWSVNDVATSELMAKFYQKMLQKKQNPATALREAQLEMWKSENWRSPYYWAAFTVQGDWR
ncbi:CHAT domain-containing protein [Ancylothrix sp. C2]|uniref:CHAT domain-containing protein n=1 Tax=Ancylothrix sp. D3o TaxID=2953691 RepID=UPI0021BBAFD0|nr:CHAT domain-containing tetratricopeptide repeat protein [Ancylothrix sp. D3o]MCT7948311.1 CHAT domain-containing protein [Ancylothrix sp. D3o]